MADRIHIAMVLRSFSVSGGLELYAHKVIEGLLDFGIKVTVFCQENQSGLSSPDLSVVKFDPPPGSYKKWQRFEHYFQATSAAVKNAGSFSLIHSQHLAVDNADVVNFHNHTVRRLSDPTVGFYWERLVNDLKLDLTPAYKVRYRQDEFLCSRAKCLVFSSGILRDDFLATYGKDGQLAGKKTIIAYPGADLADNSAAAEFDEQGRSREPFTFLFVGKGFRKKGLDVLLKAVRNLKSKGRNVRLLIAGLSAKPHDRLRLALLGVSDEVEYLGFQRDMKSVYARASGFVMPSKMEPFGMAPLQAMKHGLIPIVSKLSGVSEVLEDGRDSLILKNHLDDGELTELMEKLMDDDVFRREAGAAAIKKSAEVTWRKTVASTLQAYFYCLPDNKHLKDITASV